MKKLAVIPAILLFVAFEVFAGENYKKGQDITGSWRIEVEIPPGSSACPSDSPEPCIFLALATAVSDGTIIQTAALPDVSTGHGVWKRTGLRQFTARTVYFRLDSSGFPIGTAETVATMEIERNGLEAAGTYSNRLIDLDGNDVGGFEASATATRIVQEACRSVDNVSCPAGAPGLILRIMDIDR